MHQLDNKKLNFEPLEALLDEYYSEPLANYPEALRRRVRESTPLFPAWDRLSPEQRRSAAQQADYQENPEFEEHRNRVWTLVCQLDEVEREIREWTLCHPQNITEKATQSDRLAALSAKAESLKSLLFGQEDAVSPPAIDRPKHDAKQESRTEHLTVEESLFAEACDGHDAPSTADNTNLDADDKVAALFDPVTVPQLEAMFPDHGKWAAYAERASRNGLSAAKTGRALFNPYRAALWWLQRTRPHNWTQEKCMRKLANNVPTRSRDCKHLLTGDFD